MKNKTLFIVNIFLTFNLFGCNSKLSTKSESQANAPNQEREPITMTNVVSSTPANQNLIKEAKLALQSQNQALVNKKT